MEFKKLGLAIVDEQHRFGVEQRLELIRKKASTRRAGDDGDADSANAGADDLRRSRYLRDRRAAAGPQADRHQASDDEQVEKVYSFVKQQMTGRQAYVVYPVIEESETQAMKAAQKMHEHLSQHGISASAVGLLHGKLSSDEKEAAMEKFQRGETKILVSTTVIEVGVDVPNATVMVIEQAERFGLAQLHQLRGRVGRGGGSELLHSGDREAERPGARAHPHAGGIERWILHRRDGHEAARPGRIFRYAAIRAAGAADRQYSARRGDSGSGAQRGGGISSRTPPIAGGTAPGDRVHPRSLAAAIRIGAGRVIDAGDRRRISQPDVLKPCRAWTCGRRRIVCVKRYSMCSRRGFEGAVFADVVRRHRGSGN